MEKTKNHEIESTAERAAPDKDEQYKNIPGWGIDADPKNDPTYPMKNNDGTDHQRLNYARHPQQKQDIEVLHSLERPGLSTVFGTAAPPRGISGSLRRYAFTKGEGQASHWMTLMLADRVDVVEGIVEDLGKGHIPNFYAEKGFKAHWKHNQPAAVKQLAMTAFITAAAIGFLLVRRRKA